MTYTPVVRTLDQLLDGLLRDWHHWRTSYGMTRGYASDKASNRDRTPGHMDWWNGAADERADHLPVLAVDAAVQRIPDEPERWRTALEFNARNLALNLTVWYSPRLPPTREERDVLLLEARNKLAIELRKDGVLG